MTFDETRAELARLLRIQIEATARIPHRWTWDNAREWYRTSSKSQSANARVFAFLDANDQGSEAYRLALLESFIGTDLQSAYAVSAAFPPDIVSDT